MFGSFFFFGYVEMHVWLDLFFSNLQDSPTVHACVEYGIICWKEEENLELGDNNV